MRQTWKIAALAALSLLGSLIPSAWGEPIQKHPRVAEMEDVLAKDASVYLKGRFPDLPILVSVSVEPLRRVENDRSRSGSGQSGDSSDRLPYLDTVEDEIKDEWDDPQLNIHQLMLRVKKITVTVSLPDTILDNEANEAKDSIATVLHLTPARDEIQIQRRPWKMGAPPWLYPSIVGAALLLLLAGIFIINHTSMKRLSNAILNAKVGGGGGGMDAGAMAAAAPANTGPEERSSGPSGDLLLTDPIRTREIVLQLVDQLTRSGNFPTLGAMILMDRYARANPARLGAILVEFPSEYEKTLIALSAEPHWLEAFHRPGAIDAESLEFIRQLQREINTGHAPEIERMLVSMWRLGDKSTEFLRGLGPDLSFLLLGLMPKALAISFARKAFPGAWARILESGDQSSTVPADKVAEITKKAIALVPLNTPTLLHQYRHESELLEYLKTADPMHERDIYLAATQNSIIHKMRAPFYKVFEQEPEILADLVPRFSSEQWAMAIFNVPRDERQKLQKAFGEKQRFMIIERLKRMDIGTPPDPKKLGTLREQIGKELARIVTDRATKAEAAKAQGPSKPSESGDGDSGESDSSNAKAA